MIGQSPALSDNLDISKQALTYSIVLTGHITTETTGKESTVQVATKQDSKFFCTDKSGYAG